jgi:hypothetical protein
MIGTATENGTVRRGLLWWIAGVVLASSVVSAVVLATQAHSGIPGSTGTLYDGGRWFLLAILVAVGGVLLVTRSVAVIRSAAIVGVVTAVQLCTTGIVAAKHWRPWTGMNGFGGNDLSTLVPLAFLLAGAGFVALVACGAALRAGGIRRTDLGARYRWGGLVAGALIAVALPIVLLPDADRPRDLTAVAAYALLYSLPWGVSIAVSGWLGSIGALAAVTTVAVSAASADVSTAILYVANPARGFVPVVVLMFLIAVALIMDRLPAGREPVDG